MPQRTRIKESLAVRPSGCGDGLFRINVHQPDGTENWLENVPYRRLTRKQRRMLLAQEEWEQAHMLDLLNKAPQSRTKQEENKVIEIVRCALADIGYPLKTKVPVKYLRKAAA